MSGKTIRLDNLTHTTESDTAICLQARWCTPLRDALARLLAVSLEHRLTDYPNISSSMDAKRQSKGDKNSDEKEEEEIDLDAIDNTSDKTRGTRPTARIPQLFLSLVLVLARWSARGTFQGLITGPISLRKSFQILFTGNEDHGQAFRVTASCTQWSTPTPGSLAWLSQTFAWLVEKLGSKLLSCVIVLIDGVTRVNEFEEPGNTDDFQTFTLEMRPKASGMFLLDSLLEGRRIVLTATIIPLSRRISVPLKDHASGSGSQASAPQIFRAVWPANSTT
ncbi:hypothetical protein CPB86DRAFT_830322 [Serendipita vermifera]|nr:hypothetical protein CPB86DRAFT_830322 [Serendipita vermifera]